MQKNYSLWLLLSAVIMIALPWLAVTLVSSDNGMAVCFLLLWAIDPLYSILLGAFAGRNINVLWSLPLLSATLFLLGAWIFFDAWETVFALYALVYLVFGIAAMLISTLFTKKE